MCPEHGPVRRWLGGSGSAHLLGGALGNAPRMSLTCPLRVPVSLTCPLRVPVSLTCPIRVPYESKFVCPSYVPPPVPRMSPPLSLVCPIMLLRVPNPSGHTKRPPLPPPPCARAASRPLRVRAKELRELATSWPHATQSTKSRPRALPSVRLLCRRLCTPQRSSPLPQALQSSIVLEYPA